MKLGEHLLSGAFNTRRARRRPAINITSLIDVMFLLVIFLLVSTTFKGSHGIDIRLPAASTAEAQQPEPLELLIEQNGGYRISGEVLTAEQLRPRLEQLLHDYPDASLVLRADEAADFGAVVKAMDIARSTGIQRLVVPTRPADVIGTDVESPKPQER